jgi:hypothetical protein
MFPHNSFLFMVLLFGILGAIPILLTLASAILALNRGMGGGIMHILPLLIVITLSACTGEYLFATQVMLAFFLISACWIEETGCIPGKAALQ